MRRLVFPGSRSAVAPDPIRARIGPLALFGLGVGTTFMPMTLTATAGVPPALLIRSEAPASAPGAVGKANAGQDDQIQPSLVSRR
jgi:hypothetical protein